MKGPQTQPRLSLPKVTICSADSAYVNLTVRALQKSMELCEFGDAILFSDQPADGPFRHVPIPKLKSIDEYSNFCLTTLPRTIETEYALVIQWDGYVVDPSAWRPGFLKSDYIGAVWFTHPTPQKVGNGGFSLRSRRLLEAVRKVPWVPGWPEDLFICQLNRPILEKEFGIRFADEKLANRFSYEFKHKETFGFHGFDSMWRYLSDEEMVAIAAQVWSGRFQHSRSIWLVVDAFEHQREPLARELYAMLRKRIDVQEVMRIRHGFYQKSDIVDEVLQELESGYLAATS